MLLNVRGGVVGGRRVLFNQQPVASREWSYHSIQYNVLLFRITEHMFPNVRGRGSEAGEKFSPLACAPKCNGGGVGGRRVIFHQQPVPSREWSMVIS